MELRTVLAAVVVVVLTQDSDALKCYICSSIHPNRTCFSPIDINAIPAVECNKTNTNIARVIDSPIDGRLLQAAETATDYECVTFQKHYLVDNKTEMGRDCFPKRPEVDTCTILKVSGGSTVLLPQCDVCTTDYCNSAYELKVSGLLLLCLCLLRTAFQ